MVGLKKTLELGFILVISGYMSISDIIKEMVVTFIPQLRREGRPYRNGKFRPYRGKIKDRVSIEDRPEVVERRIRIGDWEVDSVIGKLNKSSLVTLVERVSRYTVIIRVNNKEAEVVAKAIIERAKSLKLPLKTADPTS